jgi:hypothetical protein
MTSLPTSTDLARKLGLSGFSLAARLMDVWLSLNVTVGRVVNGCLDRASEFRVSNFLERCGPMSDFPANPGCRTAASFHVLRRQVRVTGHRGISSRRRRRFMTVDFLGHTPLPIPFKFDESTKYCERVKRLIHSRDYVLGAKNFRVCFLKLSASAPDNANCTNASDIRALKLITIESLLASKYAILRALI